ncbi:MAG: DUF427 domain-containing protein [Ekhidna sp.]|nr:DUF427 domain-containing protein [Ekhidna sp.]
MRVKKVTPKPGQESVWDYPRPPKVEPVKKHIKILFDGQVVFSGNRSFRVLETSHPPTYYLPLIDFNDKIIQVSDGKSSFCEFKGMAHYYSFRTEGRVAENAGWGYAKPSKGFEVLVGHVCVYASLMDQCLVNDELVTPQPGGFYGGWITNDIVGPFKGSPGTWGW